MGNKNGFTIVELLIVVVVIAILAAITIVSYNGIQNRANDTAVQSDLRNIATKFEAYKIEKGVYPVGDTELSSTGIKVAKNSYGPGFAGLHNLLYCRVTTDPDPPTKFALMAESKSGTVYILKSETGAITTNSVWYSTGSNGNCAAVGIPQVNGTDRDLLKYSGNWASWL